MGEKGLIFAGAVSSNGALFGQCFLAISSNGVFIAETTLPPELRIDQSAGEVKLLWQANYPEYRLQSALCAAPFDWKDVTINPQTNGIGFFELALPEQENAVLFRLRKAE